MYDKTIFKNKIVYIIQSSCIDDNLVDEILSSKTNKKIGLNMENVSVINSKKFIDCLINNKFRLFNLKDEVLAYLAIIIKDGFLRSHMNITDFEANKRELIKRHFLVV